MYKLTAHGNRDNGTRVETIEITGTLEEIITELEARKGQDVQDYTFSDEGKGYVWFDDESTGFRYDGGQDAIPVYEYGATEDGDEPDYYLHPAPLPPLPRMVERYAYDALDVHSAAIVEL